MKGYGLILTLRGKQLYRMLKSVGLILLALGLPFIFIMLLSLIDRSRDGYVLSFLFGLTLLSIHNYRGDREHLLQLGFNSRLVFMIEYIVIAIVLGLTALMLVGNWQNLVMMIAAAVVVAMLPNFKVTRLKKLFFFPVSWILIRDFECRTGMRTFGWPVVLIGLIGAGMSFVSPIGPILSVILISMATASWYNYCEPMAMFKLEKGSFSFLMSKLTSLYKYLLLFYLPSIILFLFFHLELWYLLLVAVLFGILINSFAIFYKYAAYHPSRQNLHSETAIGIFSFSSLVPFFAPVCIFYLIVYARRAFQNVNSIYATG